MSNQLFIQNLTIDIDMIKLRTFVMVQKSQTTTWDGYQAL